MMQDNTGRGLVITLSCSGGNGKPWAPLAEALGDGFVMQAPEHYGVDWNAWHGGRAFGLSDEAERTIALIDASPEHRIHLVGHSYGGGVALHVALARPHRIASLSLYEPSAFHLLSCMGAEGAPALAEISSVARDVCEGVLTGDHERAMERFIDYWNAPGSWAALRPAARDGLRRWASKCPLEFHALLSARTSTLAFARLKVPTLILCGGQTRVPSRLICEYLAGLLPLAEMATVEAAGHMGPLTHQRPVHERMAAHILNASGHGITVLLNRPVPAANRTTYGFFARSA